MLWILGCADQLHSPYGEEPVRAAFSMQYGENLLVAIANSYVRCEADAENDPKTTQDEAAIDKSYWAAQVASAMTREGAMVVILQVPGTGEWTLGEDNSYASWFYIEEASSIYQSGIISTSVPMDVAFTASVESGMMSLDETGKGSFDFPEEELSGAFTAAPCNNANLLTLVNNLLIELASGPSVTVVE